MHAYVVFAHPTRRSFTGAVLDALCRGIEEAGHTFEIGDLYAMGFNSDLSLAEYERETNVHGNRAHSPLPADVRAEHEKISRADGLAFVFPVWWSDCPAKMKGWFDRVWVCGYAYDYGLPNETFPYPPLSVARALVLCPGGNTGDALHQSGVAEGMRRIFANDRLQPGVGVDQCEFVLLPGTEDPQRAAQSRTRNLATARRAGRDFLTAEAGRGSG
ncbi:MAG: NAD(P)H-dependent oxidoreductase [Spirochaetaceae bacterium]|nr:NAD(P)H-dependent oxidoreductase [Spirochaetaceae bacterium]